MNSTNDPQPDGNDLRVVWVNPPAPDEYALLQALARTLGVPLPDEELSTAGDLTRSDTGLSCERLPQK